MRGEHGRTTQGESSITSPDRYVEHYLAENGLGQEDVRVSPTVLLTWTQYAAESLKELIGGVRARHWFYDAGHVEHPLYHGSVGEQPISVAVAPEGAPATVVMMEELIVCGAERFIGLGWAGSIDPDLAVGDVLIARSAISEEGTSRHYIPSHGPIVGDEGLVQRFDEAATSMGVPHTTGGVWTTDAPYRELPSTASRMRASGVMAVDMETSAMYTLGIYRKVSVCNLLCVSDVLDADWSPSFRAKEVHQATDRAAATIAKLLKDV